MHDGFLVEPKLDMSQALDEVKLYQLDTDVCEGEVSADEHVDHFWNAVFTAARSSLLMRLIDMKNRFDWYKQIQLVAASGLVLHQTDIN